MATQPTDEDITKFCELTFGINRDEAILRLKNNNNNVTHALNEFFDDGPNHSKYRYVEDHFHGDRDAVDNNKVSGSSFSIQAPDAGRMYFVGEAAPSRPPSRINNNRSKERSPMEDSWLATTGDQDQDLAKALAASREEAGLPAQETGITRSGPPEFGPATREDYEQDKWAMVPVKSFTQEVIVDLEAIDRKRLPDTPAFLRPSIANHRLGALLTIYHTIPLAREVFLDRLNVIPNYGSNSEWWSGKPIILPQMLTSERKSPEIDPSTLLHELQRLMAFLDKTDRAYGSADVLADLDLIKPLQWSDPDRTEPGPMDVEAAVMYAWSKLFEDIGGIKKFFTTGVSGDIEAEIQRKDFAILDLDLPKEDEPGSTFYDMADALLWPEREPPELARSPYLTHVGSIIAFRIRGSDRSKTIEVPAVWYPDRYMQSGREAAFKMRLKKQEYYDKINSLTALENKLSLHKLQNGTKIPINELIDKALQHDQAIPDKLYPFSYLPKKKGGNLPSAEPAESDFSIKLRKLLSNIEAKLAAIKKQKEEITAELNQLGNLFTKQSSDPNEPKLHKYTLCGASTSKSTTYICKQGEVDLINLSDDTEAPQNQEQWWKIDYDLSGVASPIVQKSTFEAVLQAAREGCRGAILVYANEKALKWPSKPLPTALETFVRNDNTAFEAELSSSQPNIQIQPSSPPKRKFDESGGDPYEDNNRIGSRGQGGSHRENQTGSDGTIGGFDGARSASSSLETVLADRSVAHNDFPMAEVILGVDPADPDPRGIQDDSPPQPGPEMQELNGFRLLTSSPPAVNSSNSLMEIDQVMMDSEYTEESAAVSNMKLTD